MPPSTGALTEALEVFLNIFESGITRIMPGTMSIFGILTAIELTLAGLFWAMSGDEALGKFLKKCLLIFFLIWVVNSYMTILGWVVDGFIYTGTTVVGTSATGKSVMEDPSQVIDKGLEQIVPVFELAVRLGADWNFFDAAVTFLCGMITFAAYMILALQVFITRIEFALITTLGLILLPFGALKQTSFIAEKVFGAILSFGIKFMVLALVIEIAYPALTKYSLPTDPSWNQMLTFIAISFSFVVLALHAPALAAGMLSGTPSLTTASAGAAAGFSAAVATHGVGGAGRVVDQSALGVARGIGKAYSGVSSSYNYVKGKIGGARSSNFQQPGKNGTKENFSTGNKNTENNKSSSSSQKSSNFYRHHSQSFKKPAEKKANEKNNKEKPEDKRKEE